MTTRLTRTRWLPVVSGAVAAVLAFASLPMTALANDELSPGPYSQSSQLSTDAYSALGLTVSDDTGDAGTYAPYGNDENVSTTLLSDDEVYMAANGARKMYIRSGGSSISSAMLIRARKVWLATPRSLTTTEGWAELICSGLSTSSTVRAAIQG